MYARYVVIVVVCIVVNNLSLKTVFISVKTVFILVLGGVHFGCSTLLFLVQAWAPSANFAMSLICQQEVDAAHPAPARGRGKRNVVKAECQQEVEAAHPAPAWGRWYMQWLQVSLVLGTLACTGRYVLPRGVCPRVFSLVHLSNGCWEA